MKFAYRIKFYVWDINFTPRNKQDLDSINIFLYLFKVLGLNRFDFWFLSSNKYQQNSNPDASLFTNEAQTRKPKEQSGKFYQLPGPAQRVLHSCVQFVLFFSKFNVHPP